MNKSGIYTIVNKTNGKKYIGSTIDFCKRWKGHVDALKKQCHHSILLQRAWNKYSEESFSFEVIEEIIDKSRLLEREQHYLDTLEPEYNVCKVAGNCLGRRFSEESIQKMRESHRNITDETRKRFSTSHLGKIIPEEVRRKMCQPRTEEHKRNISRARLGMKFSDETKKKMRNRVISEETREKMRQKAKQRKHSEETKKILSKIAKEKWIEKKKLKLKENNGYHL
jgi:group I intron endonuclease